MNQCLVREALRQPVSKEMPSKYGRQFPNPQIMSVSWVLTNNYILLLL